MDEREPLVLVTGGSGLVGRSVALNMARSGYRVLVVGRTLANLESVAVQSPNILLFEGDLTIEDSRRSLVTHVMENYGGVDILVNNIGISSYGDISSTDTQSISDQINTNFASVAMLTQQVVAADNHLQQLAKLHRKLRLIINISSSAARPGRSFPNYSIYSATKSALDSLTHTWAVELGSRKIQVVSIAPGVVEPTPSARRELEDFYRQIESATPLGRLTTPDDIAWWVRIIASETGRFLTGSTLVLDGGLSLARI